MKKTVPEMEILTSASLYCHMWLWILICCILVF